MPCVIPVRFTYANKDLWFELLSVSPVAGDHVICETERGLEIGLCVEDPQEMSLDELAELGVTTALKPVVRIATAQDLDYADQLAVQGERALPHFRRLVKESGLDIKPVGVEYPFDSDRVVCYFSAEERVDFRQLVRDLSREFGSRVDMRQIGVREEAALIGGYAHCGQELCCARFGRQFEPVSIRMAKEQDLPLNSSKISGACGRLMCCLRYEFDAYRDFKSRAPKKNALIDTPLGKAKIAEYDTPKEQLALRLENGKLIRVPLSGMQASEAARKKSQELNCPCRPDTVSRSMLESLESPEVQMALAELDRANGLLGEDSFEASDLFVETVPQKTRRTRQAEATEADKTNDVRPKSRRRRHGQQNRDDVQPQETIENNEHGEVQVQTDRAHARTRRRRPGDRGGSQANRASHPSQISPDKHSEEQQNRTDRSLSRSSRNRRRRHHSTSQTKPDQMAATNEHTSPAHTNDRDGASGAQQSDSHQRRRRRRSNGSVQEGSE